MRVLHNTNLSTLPIQASAATASVSRSTYSDLYLTLRPKLQKTHIFIIMCHAACWLPKDSRLLQIIAFYDFVYFVSVVSRQLISFVTKMEVADRITSSRLVFTSLLRVWDRIDLMITVNTSSRSQWNAALCTLNWGGVAEPKSQHQTWTTTDY